METQEQRTAAPEQDDNVETVETADEVVEERDETADEPAVTPLTRRKRARHRAVPLLPEYRHLSTDELEIREGQDRSGDTVEVVGMPIVYDQPYRVVDLQGEFEERMLPGVASAVLARGADVRFLMDHQASQLLARTTSGTLRLTETPIGLEMAATVDLRDSDARNLIVRLERRDLTQMSCGFMVARDRWDASETHRDIVSFSELLDVSSVTYPASPTTSIDIARRMALEMPIESRARLRRLYAELRAGRVLSAAHQDMLLQATQALHSVLGASGADMSSLMPELPDVDDDGDIDENVPEPGVSTIDDASIGGGLAGAGDGTLTDPGDVPIVHRNFSNLRREVELRKRRRTA